MFPEASSEHPTAGPKDVLALAGHISDLVGTAVETGSSLTHEYPGWESRDFRRTFFVKFSVVCQATVAALSFQANCLMRSDWWRSANSVLGIPADATDDQLAGHARAFFVFARCGFTHLIFSQIEATLRAFLRTLVPSAVNGASGEFKNVYECLLRTHLGMGRNANESVLTRLDLFRMIRNLIHNNGLYLSRRAQDEAIVFRGVLFRFRHNQHALMVGWPTLIDLIGALLADMEGVVRHPAIADYPAVIEDPVLEHEVAAVDPRK